MRKHLWNNLKTSNYMNVNKLFLLSSLLFIFVSCAKKENNYEILLTTGHWQYEGTFVFDKREIGQGTLGDSLQILPIDTEMYGVWTFNINGNFLDIKPDKSILYGKWQFNEDENLLRISVDSFNNVAYNDTYIKKKISKIDENELFFDTKFGTSENPILIREIFKHKK